MSETGEDVPISQECMSQKAIITHVPKAQGFWAQLGLSKVQAGPDKLLDETPEGYYLVADTAFPRTAVSIQSRIKTPLKSYAQLPQRTEIGTISCGLTGS